MYETQVRNGIEFMQREHPGALSRIDRDTLDIRLYAHCVIGQTLGSFEFHQMVADNGPQWMADHGFDLEDSIGRPEKDYEPLTEAWKAALSELFPED